MSYLTLPRIHFIGTTRTTPPTTNNNNYNRVLDPEHVKFFPPYDPAQMDDETFRQNMRTLVKKSFNPFPIPDAWVLNGNWNYYGDNYYYFNASIVAVEMGNNTGPNRITSPAQDGLIGTPVQLLGNKLGDNDTPSVMVDCDPTSNFSTQLFSGKFVFGATGCGCTAASTDAVPLPRAYTRWLDLARNLAETPDAKFGTIWMQPLPLATLVFDNSGNQSPSLALLQQLASAGQGLQVRFINYYFRRLYTDPELAQLFAQGNYAMNESDGILVGTIGAWNAPDPGTYAPGRMLLPNTTPMSFPGKNPTPYTLAPAAAFVDATRQVIVLDLAMAFPEVTQAPPPPVPPPPPASLSKINLGTATLQVLNSDGSTTVIGTFAYDTTTYLATSGVVEVPFTPQQQGQIFAGALQVVCSNASVSPVLTEKINVADADEHCIYLTEGESTTVQFRLRVRGSQPISPVPVRIDQYRCIETDPAPVKGIPLKWMYLVPSLPMAPQPYIQVTPTNLNVGGNGIANVTIKGLRPGLGFIRFVAGPSTDNPVPVIGPDMGLWMGQMSWAFFVNVRVLPADQHLATVPDSQITWDFVYSNVLQYYYRLYPVMDNFLMLNDPNDAGSAAGKAMIKLRSNKNVWTSSLYMPHTRELSDGKRILLQRWCDLPPENES